MKLMSRDRRRWIRFVKQLFGMAAVRFLFWFAPWPRSTSTYAAKSLNNTSRTFSTERRPSPCSGRSQRRCRFTVQRVLKSQSCLGGDDHHKLKVEIKPLLIIILPDRGVRCARPKLALIFRFSKHTDVTGFRGAVAFQTRSCLKFQKQKWQKIYLCQGKIFTRAKWMHTLSHSSTEDIWKKWNDRN